MFRGVLAAIAVACICAPASSAVIYQQSGQLSPPAYGWQGLRLDLYKLGFRGGIVNVSFDLNGTATQIIPTFETHTSTTEECFIDLCGGADSYVSLSQRTGETRPDGYSGRVVYVNEDHTKNYSPSDTLFYTTDQYIIAFAVEADQPLSYTLTVSNDVPEPATWAMVIAGFGLAGSAARRRIGAARPA